MQFSALVLSRPALLPVLSPKLRAAPSVLLRPSGRWLRSPSLGLASGEILSLHSTVVGLWTTLCVLVVPMAPSECSVPCHRYHPTWS